MKNEPGIQRREQADGTTRYRGVLKHQGKVLNGPWGTLPDAKAWRAQAVADKAKGKSLLSGGDTISSSSERFLKGIASGVILSRKQEPYAPATVRDYHQYFRDYINPELGHIHVTSLRRSQVQRWVDEIATRRAGATVRSVWSALAALYAWLLPRNDELLDPTDGVILPRAGKPREHYATPEEMEAFLAPLPHDLALPFALAFYAGLRRGEIQALPLDHIEEDWIVVEFSLDLKDGFKGPKSGPGHREVPVFDSLRPYLAELPRCRRRSTRDLPGDLALPSTRRSKWGARHLGEPFMRSCREHWGDLGTIGLHEGRHSFATALLRAGYDVRQVQEWMGHRDPTTTLRIYAKAEGRRSGMADKMNNYLIGAR